MHFDEIIRFSISLGFVAGALMIVPSWYIGYGLHTVFSVFKQITK